MGELYDEYLKKRKKNKKQIAEEWNQENPNQKISSDDLAPVRTKARDGDIAPVRKKNDDDLAPVRTKRSTNTSERSNRSTKNFATSKTTPIVERSKKSQENTTKTFKEFVGGYIDKGGLDEGITTESVAKTILGTNVKLGKSFREGILGGAEGAIDAGTFVVAKGAESLGFDKFAEKAYNFQQRNLLDEAKVEEKVLDKILKTSPFRSVHGAVSLGDMLVDEDRYSATGEKLDATIESAGQLGAVIGLQAAGIPWWMTTGTMAFGQETTSALQQGATSNEAAVSGAITAGSEILFEKLSGGIKLGGKTVGDHLVKPLVDKISNKTVKTLAKYGLGSVGEGFEEVGTEIFSNIGRMLTYEDEKTLKEILTSEESMERYLDAFIGGAAISGGINVGRAVKSVKTGRDYETGLSADEQKVVSEEVKKRTGERQKEIAINEEVERRIANRDKGTNLTAAEKRNIRKTVMEELESGELELDYSQTKVKGKETAEIESQVIEDLKNGYVDMDDIENMFAGEEFEQLKALMSELKKNPTPERKTEVEAKIDEIKGAAEGKMNDLLQNSPYFAESYRQRQLKGESFTREEQDTDTEITKELVESAKAAGMNNTRRMQELFEYTNKIANDTDTKYGFINDKQLKEMGYSIKDATINGMVRVQEDGSTKILINVDSKKALNTIIGHETTHLLEGTKEYTDLATAVKEYATMKGEYDSRIKAVKELYKNVDANIENEVTADLVGDYIFTDEQFIQELTKKPNVFQKVYDYIKHAYKMATAGSAEARQLQKAKRAFEKAYRNTQVSVSQTTRFAVQEGMNEEERHEKLKNSEIKIATKKKNEILDNYDIKDKNLNSIFRFIKDNRENLGLNGTFNKEDIQLEFSYSNTGVKKSLMKTAADKVDAREYLDALSCLDEIIDNSILIERHGDKKTPQNENLKRVNVLLGAYRKGNDIVPVQLEIKEFTNEQNQLYFVVSIKKSEVVDASPAKADSTSISDIISIADLIKKINPEAVDFLKYIPDEFLNEAQLEGKKIGIDRDIKKYPNSPYKAQDRFSVSDTKGRELSKDQQEYFKDSKVRDENGKLKIMYHGTPDGSFTVFKDGSYFTEHKAYADRYQNTSASSISSGKVAANPKTFEVYLDIKKPFDLSDPVARGVYINDYIKGGNAMGINPYLSDAEYDAIETIDWTEGEDLRDFLIENEYDYDGLVLDEGADGGYGDDVLYRGKSYVVFSPEQVKSVENENPTDDEDIRFSLSNPVENNKNLVALHNLNSNTLLKQLDLGGMPMPSVAITDPSKVDHTGFGDVTLILNKDAIDPKKSKFNKVYSNDAYTPTFPQIRYEANEKVADRVADKVRNFIDQVHDQFQGDLRRLRYSSEMDDLLNDEGGQQGVIDRFRNAYGMKQLYLAEKGETIPLETKRVEIPIDELKKETYDYIIEKMGEDAVRSSKNTGLTGRQWFDQHGEQIKQVYHDFFVEGGSTEEQVSNFINNRKPVYFVGQVREAAKYLENGGVEVQESYDYEKARNLIDEKITQSDYDTWLNNLFDGIEGTSGIRNNKDIFTPSGNRRSFKQTHDPVTLDNIVKVMRGEAQQKGQAVLGGSMFGASAKEYKSIKEMKDDAHRLGRLEEIENKESRDYISNAINEIAQRYAGDKDWWDARNALIEAVGHSETKAGITKYLKQYDYVYKYDESIVDDLIELRDYVRNLTVPYFEAKPQRAVSFEEVGVYVIPNNADAELKRRLLEEGYSIAEYNPDIEGDRQKVVNQFEEYKFSLSKNDDLAPVGGYTVYGKDVKVDEDLAPVRKDVAAKAAMEDLAPVKATTSKTEIVEDIAPIATNDVVDVDPSIFEPWPDEVAAEPIADYDGTTVPMDTESMRLLTKNMKEVLGLNQTQRSILKDIIQDYSTGKIATGNDLYNAITDQFGVQSYEVRNEELMEVKKALRENKIRVSDELKDGITDYFKFRQRNFNKLKLGNEGLPVDVIYEGLSELYPGHFPADIINPEDQLYRMEEVANLESSVKEEYILPEERIAEATDFIRESVSDYKRVKKLNSSLKWKNPDGTLTRAAVHAGYMQNIKDAFAEKGMDLESVLANGKNLSTFATVDNTPQRVMEKTFGYKEGQLLSDLTVNKAAENETEAIRWLNSFTNKKNGTLAKLSKKYHIKPFSKEDAAAQKYAEGMHVNQYGDYVEYGDRELEADIKDPQMRANIKAFVADPTLRKIYDDTLTAINASRTRNGYAPIPRRNDYFLHFREMDDTFYKIGIPFNPNDIKAKDLPTDINGMTADNKPGQPWFGSSMQRKGVGTTYSLLGGMEKYLTAAKPQIFHIDDIQVLRALRNSIADTYGQAKGLESLDTMTDEEAEARIEQVYSSHLSSFAKFLNEEANIMAGKTALIDRGLEGVLGRRAVSFMNTLNSQVAKNMIGFNISSSLTNFVSVTQAAAKASKYDVIKAFAQTTSNKLKSIAGKGDGFAEKNSAIVRRKGQDKFYKKWWEKASDTGFLFMSAIDDISTEFIVRTKYNELTRKGMSEEQAHDEAGKWAMRILGDRSFGQMPQIFNSKTLGLVTKFQLEVRNQLDAMFYDTVQEANVSTEEIQNKTARNAVKAAKITSTVVQLAVFQHLFGKAFESVAGYNPAFDIIENLMTLFGFDDEEDSEDTFGDNLEQALLGLGEDLPYFSALTGGRIPIEAALPIEQLVQGKDDYGNDKPRLETLGEALPYYVMPTGYGQIKKSAAGLKMFDKDLPIAGSYTDSGNLRFPVAPTPQNIAQAAVFGQWANENAREYFDGEHAPLKEKQIQEFKDLDLPIADYWKIREGMSGKKKAEEKLDYIDSLDLPISKKNILANNALNRKEPVDMTDYDEFDSLEEMDFAVKNPEKYAVSKAVGGYTSYKTYNKALDEIKADKDSEGKTIRDSRKAKVVTYINGLDANYGTKLILYKKEYPSDDSYNADIINYLNERGDINYEEKKQVLEELGFTVYADGSVGW